MPFIGNQPALSYTSFAKQDFTTSATTSYTLDNPVANANELALFINFVRQEPTTAYTASGTSLTLTSATSASDDMYCVYLGKAVQTVNPPAGSVGTSQLADASVTPAKLNLNDNLLFNTSSKGIYLGVTSATASNLLDDYEEGDWTPTYNSGLTSVTYDAQQGQYTKVGRMVSFAFRLENSAGTANGNRLEVSGLPFTTNSSQPGSGANWMYQPAGITGDQTITPILLIPLNNNIIAFYNAAGGSFVGSDLVSTTNDIYIRGVYFTN
jgi:hypothetical protein